MCQASGTVTVTVVEVLSGPAPAAVQISWVRAVSVRRLVPTGSSTVTRPPSVPTVASPVSRGSSVVMPLRRSVTSGPSNTASTAVSTPTGPMTT